MKKANVFFDEKPILQGIEDAHHAFSAPPIVHLDLTNACNLSCPVCWCHSPHLKENAPTPQWLRQKLSWSVLESFVEDLSRLGGRCLVKLTGGGEPTLHPHFLDLIVLLKNQGHFVDLHTNGTQLDCHTVEQLVSSGLDSMTVSLWAGSPEAYAAIHGERHREDFSKIIQALQSLSSFPHARPPELTVHNVITNLNYWDIKAMLNTASKIGASAVHFKIMDPMPGQTESFLLNRSERAEMQADAQQIVASLEPNSEYYQCPETGRRIRLLEIHELARSIRKNSSTNGIYNLHVVDRMPCYIGWTFVRILADGTVTPCCKGHRMDMGNLNNEKFCDIWLSKKYNNFRNKALTLPKSHPFFRIMGNMQDNKTGCYNCDNIGHNDLIQYLWVESKPWPIKYYYHFKNTLQKFFS